MNIETETIRAALTESLGENFVGSVTFHVPPQGRVRMVIETKLGKTESVIDRGHRPALRSVANK